MALTASTSLYEAARVAALAYEGLPLRVTLHAIGLTGYDANTPMTDWATIELDEVNGYEPFELAALPAGGVDLTDGRFEIGEDPGANTFITAAFTGADAGFTYDTVVVCVDGSDYPHSVLTESPSITLAPGATQTYQIQLLGGPLV